MTGQIKKLLHGVVDKPADFGVKIENQASVVKIAKSLYDFEYANLVPPYCTLWPQLREFPRIRPFTDAGNVTPVVY